MGRLLDFFNHKYPYSDFHELNADWLISAYKELVAEVDVLDTWKAQHEVEYQELKEFMDQIESGVLPEAVYNNLITWLQANAFDIIGEMIKFISVGLTTDGHLLITIPEQWKDITFRVTGYDINVPVQPEFGHLCILY